MLKVHADAGACNAEIVAFALVGNSPVLPRLLATADASRSLLIEYIPRPFDWSTRDAGAVVVDAVAAIHAAPELLDVSATEVFAAFRLDRLAAAPAPQWLPEPGGLGRHPRPVHRRVRRPPRARWAPGPQAGARAA